MVRDSILFGTLAVLLVGIAFAIYDGTITGPKGTAYSTLILVAITGYYVFITRLLVNETEKARRQELSPELEIECVKSGVKLVNIGSGPALRIRACCSLDDDDRLSIKRTHLRAGDSLLLDDNKINNATDPDSEISEQYCCFHLEGSYRNVFQETKPLKKAIPLKRLTTESQRATEAETRAALNHLEGIKTQLTKIASEMVEE